MPRRNRKQSTPTRGLGDKRGRHKKATTKGLAEKVKRLEQQSWFRPGTGGAA